MAERQLFNSSESISKPFFKWSLNLSFASIKQYISAFIHRPVNRRSHLQEHGAAHKHGLHAESNLDQRFLRSREKSEPLSIRQGPKLYSKVLTITPFHLLQSWAQAL